MIERSNPIPLYEQLKNKIIEQIDEGILKPGQQIPSERELCEKYNVSRITVRQAISLAVNEGILLRSHGRGTFVAGPKIQQGLTKISNFEQTLAQQGIVGSTDLLNTDVIPNDFYFSRLLNISINEPIVNIELLGYGNELPLVYYTSYFSFNIGNKFINLAKEKVANHEPFSTLDLYGNLSELYPTHTEQTIEAIVSDDRLSELLKVEKGSPLLNISSIIYSGNQPLEYKEAFYRGDKYKFFITREFNFNGENNE
ncbi:GntR family transcriptional regulator [Microaerobacter geothermalis]|uniref:GntR family transcriptional regulator n=1 Tax=Microaerobacter geothermalis TaxID=674972 RepID=UPI001F3FD219|nr:GntR family transcriptional regulator [Microaerobacter geothermalis]MCF6095259.1 GntR family transcriptional regulator [Microaerobacter geothermalis]